MKKLALFPVIALLLFCTFSAYAKKADWHKGIIYLQNNEVMKGKVSFDQKLNLIQYKADEKIKVFSPIQVKLFQFYDTESERNRVYTSVTELMPGNWLKKKFFEVVLTGNITLLRTHQHTAIEQKPVPIQKSPLIRTREFQYVEVVRYDYYIMHDNKLEKLDNFKKDVLPLIGLSKKEFRNFIAENDLNFRDRKDQVRIIEHFNKKENNTSISLL